MRKIAFLTLCILISCSNNQQKIQPAVEYWITSGDRHALLEKSGTGLSFAGDTTLLPVIQVDSSSRFQTIDGFGFALTGGSAYLINQKLSPAARDTLLKELFHSDSNHIGISYLRISIGSSDLDDHVFTYDDLPPGQKDPGLTKFSLEPDRKNLIPLLKKIVALSPELKIMASPWSAPSWMKSNDSTKGGSLKPEFYKSYADYLVEYIFEMAREGIMIDAITIQNEPENPKNNPSMVMTAIEQANFIKKSLGPALKTAALKTKIVVYDHNADHPEYPLTILNDPEAKKFVDGSAFHLYGGKIDALSEVHKAHKDRNLYFTEQWTSGKSDFREDLLWATKNLIIGAPRNWSKNVLEWNLANDPTFDLHTPGGCTECMGALTIGDSITRNVSYYIIAHASKFVRPGSFRVFSTESSDVPNVAFTTPDGRKVLIAVNEGNEIRRFGIKYKNKVAPAALPPGSVGTWVW